MRVGLEVRVGLGLEQLEWGSSDEGNGGSEPQYTTYVLSKHGIA